MISEIARLLMGDMLAFARKAVRFYGGLDAAAIDADEMRLFALIRALEMNGAVASKVPVEDRERVARVPWRRIIDFRNLLIHGYGRVRTEALVEAARDHVPALIAEIERILNDGVKG